MITCKCGFEMKLGRKELYQSRYVCTNPVCEKSYPYWKNKVVIDFLLDVTLKILPALLIFIFLMISQFILVND